MSSDDHVGARGSGRTAGPRGPMMGVSLRASLWRANPRMASRERGRDVARGVARAVIDAHPCDWQGGPLFQGRCEPREVLCLVGAGVTTTYVRPSLVIEPLRSDSAPRGSRRSWRAEAPCSQASSIIRDAFSRLTVAAAVLRDELGNGFPVAMLLIRRFACEQELLRRRLGKCREPAWSSRLCTIECAGRSRAACFSTCFVVKRRTLRSGGIVAQYRRARWSRNGTRTSSDSCGRSERSIMSTSASCPSTCRVVESVSLLCREPVGARRASCFAARSRQAGPW